MNLSKYQVASLAESDKEKVVFALTMAAQPSEVCSKCGEKNKYGGKHYRGICGKCRRACRHVAISGYIIKRNGVKEARRKCLLCFAGQSQLGNPPVGSQIFDLCLEDLRDGTTCERCGSISGVEYHHWAPRNTFADADEWPTAWLCRDCHRLWHQTMDGYRWHASRPDWGNTAA